MTLVMVRIQKGKHIRLKHQSIPYILGRNHKVISVVERVSSARTEVCTRHSAESPSLTKQTPRFPAMISHWDRVSYPKLRLLYSAP